MIDLETKSDIDIAKSGVYRYADSPYFDILLFAYSVDDAPVQVVDLASGEQLPEEILNALTDDRIQKHAFNASFERICLSVWLHRNYPECFVSGPAGLKAVSVAATTSARTHGDARWWQLPIWACR